MRGGVALGVVGFVALIIFMTVWGMWYTVDATQRAVVLNFGRIHSVNGPGLHFKIPWVQTVHKISTSVQAVSWSAGNPMESYSKDQQPAVLQINVTYRIQSDEAALKLFYESYRDNDTFVGAILAPRILEGVKNIFGQYNAVAAIQERTRLNADIERELKRLVVGPVIVESFQIQDVKFSDAYEKSIEERMLAEVEVERVRQNKNREQLQADIKVIQATADAAAVKLAGDATAAAIEARGKALGDNPLLVSLVAAEKWNGVLPTTMLPDASVPFISVQK